MIASKADAPWVTIETPDPESASLIACVACVACGRGTIIFLDEDLDDVGEDADAVVDRLNAEYERHRGCAELVTAGSA